MTAEIVTLYRGHSIYSRDGGTIKLRGKTLYTGTGSMLASQAMIDLLVGPSRSYAGGPPPGPAEPAPVLGPRTYGAVEPWTAPGFDSTAFQTNEEK